MSVTRLPALYLPRGGDGQAPGARWVGIASSRGAPVSFDRDVMGKPKVGLRGQRICYALSRLFTLNLKHPAPDFLS